MDDHEDGLTRLFIGKAAGQWITITDMDDAAPTGLGKPLLETGPLRVGLYTPGALPGDIARHNGIVYSGAIPLPREPNTAFAEQAEAVRQRVADGGLLPRAELKMF